MKTVYSIDADMFGELEKVIDSLNRDSNTALSVGRRKNTAARLELLRDSLLMNATQQVEPTDRKEWQREERRKFDRRIVVVEKADATDATFAIFGRHFPAGGL